MSTERGEKLTENILPDGENWNITLVSLPAQIHSDRLEMIYGSGGMEEESMRKGNILTLAEILIAVQC